MLPPVIEIYIVWHPGDAAGAVVAETFLEHFHGSVFSGLLGGAIEVYMRSKGWCSADDAPRPVPLPGTALPGGLLPAKFVAVLPLLGNELASSVQAGSGPWYDYVKTLVSSQAASNGRIGIFPLLLDDGADEGTVLGNLLGRHQQLARPDPAAPKEPVDELRCRDLAQVLAQLLGEPVRRERIRVFLSHTKRATAGAEADVASLIQAVRDIISDTRLGVFFDANALQPGEDWDEHLRQEATTGAFLALRSDLYASRAWCQREMLIAKQAGLPIVVLDALSRGEERGSFLLDHVPRVPVRRDEEGHWRIADIRRSLNLLVDECLKRALWRHQQELAKSHQELQVAWWAPHAPEPVTLAHWFVERQSKSAGPDAATELRVLHPDPPLGPEEQAMLNEVALLAGIAGGIDILTPRTLAARGG